jgi:hypothetical protein
MELGTNAIPKREDINPVFIDKVLLAIAELEKYTDVFLTANVNRITNEIQKILIADSVHPSNATLVDIHYVLMHKEHYRRQNALQSEELSDESFGEQLELELVGEA